MAASKSNVQEQKALLMQALEEVRAARGMEEGLLKAMTENALLFSRIRFRAVSPTEPVDPKMETRRVITSTS